MVEAGERAKTHGRSRAGAARARAARHVAVPTTWSPLGGGVVGDLAGFCAATYQRGIDVVQVPTTLVAQVDSAYGGKTGVDLPEAKNYVGAYHQPAAVLTDPATLATLPPAELAAGFVEVIKTALIAGGSLWERVRAIDELDPADLDELIFACARTKLEVVAADERDAGPRQVLNLGHTVGHAIEAATGYRRYRHGEAVGLGLLAALRLSSADGASRRGRGAARAPRPADRARPRGRHRRRARGARARQEADRRRASASSCSSGPGEPRAGPARSTRLGSRAAVRGARPMSRTPTTGSRSCTASTSTCSAAGPEHLRRPHAR